MTDDDASPDAPAAPTGPIAADPFAFWPALASRVRGLGGDRAGSRAGDDPAYAFHTAYHALPEGPVRLSLLFDGLAGEGALVVRVNALDEAGAAETVRDWTIRLGELGRDGGRASFRFDAVAGRRYAALGHLYQGEAAADALSVTLEPVVEREPALARARAAMPARPVFRRAAALLSGDPATLRDPVSQTCTAAQFEEADYARWAERLAVPVRRHRKQWEYVYILRVLERYGALVPGARGLGFGVGREPLAAAMAAAGADVVATDLDAGDARAMEWGAGGQHAGGLEGLRHPAVCDDALFDRRVTFRAADMGHVPDDLSGFDFCWSSCALEHLGSIRAGLAFAIRSVECLAPGGLAVHTTELNCASDDDTVTEGGTVLFRRRDLDRLAVELVSRGHGVAQLKYDLGNLPEDGHVDAAPFSGDGHLKLELAGYVATSFGIVVRRGE